MNRPWRYLFPLLGLWLAVPVFAGDKDQLRCGVNQDRVWVYDTLTSFDIGARLKCGESVEIVSRVKGYVKIRNANGVEGYVPDSALPDLPPLPDPDDKIVAASAGPAPSSGGETSLAAAARRARGAAKSSPAISTPTNPDNPAPSASLSAAPPQQQVAAASSQPPAAVAPTIATAPVVATNSAPAPISVPAPAPAVLVANSSTAPASVVASNAKPTSAPPPPWPAAPSKPVVAEASHPSTIATESTPAPVAAPAPTPTGAANPLPAQAPGSVGASVASPMPVALAVNPSAVSIPAAPSDTKATSAPPKSAKHSKPAPERAVTPPLPTLAPAPASVKAPSLPVNEAKLEGAARTYPIRDIVTPSRAEAASTLVEVPIGSEYPDTQPENESADPACHTFFSAYGLSPSQFKWLAANRRKLYPSICPAPSLASVDFVVLFTHDSDTYNAAMPTPVHTDRAGFSDFNPLTTIDTALLSGPDADRAHREYVWVFRTRRGGFDPMKFSPRRRPQFSTTESKGSARAIEDAFNYLQEQGTRLEAAQ